MQDMNQSGEFLEKQLLRRGVEWLSATESWLKLLGLS